jgi:uncharacterized Zn finger protein
MWYNFAPKPTVARRAVNADQQLKLLRASPGEKPEPLHVEGRKFVRQFWGTAWCQHIEKFCDAHNRLGRGRSYLRGRCVVDFKLRPGEVVARVMGSALYRVSVAVEPLAADVWKRIKERCAGKVGSTIELLSGRLSSEVMTIITDPAHGLFPLGSQMKFSCTCPDGCSGNWMCKHVAATLYGIGVRIDGRPEQLFTLRGMDHLELIESATVLAKPTGSTPGIALGDAELGEVFGIEVAGLDEQPKFAGAGAAEPSRSSRNSAQASRSGKAASPKSATSAKGSKARAPEPRTKTPAPKLKRPKATEKPAGAKSQPGKIATSGNRTGATRPSMTLQGTEPTRRGKSPR